METMEIVREILDRQIVDRDKRRMGKVDGIVLRLRKDAPPRVAFLRTGAAVLAARISRRLEKLVLALSRRASLDEPRCQIPWRLVKDIGLDIDVDVDAEETAALEWERWFRETIVCRLPGGKPTEDPEVPAKLKLEAPSELGENEIAVETLLGKKVRDRNGKPVGRIEELAGEEKSDELVVREYLVGRRGMAERFSINYFGLAMIRRLGGRSRSADPHRIPWRKLDVSDPKNPRLTCSREELEAESGASDAT